MTLCFLTLCASVGSEKVSTLFDARCNHEVYGTESSSSMRIPGLDEDLLSNARLRSVGLVGCFIEDKGLVFQLSCAMHLRGVTAMKWRNASVNKYT